jgi:NAD(P)-dependent dehydrogenase (short-subunit alcohol dehydrogenase family)
MSEKQVWLVTGAGRGMGTDIAKAALAAGHAQPAQRSARADLLDRWYRGR